MRVRAEPGRDAAPTEPATGAPPGPPSGAAVTARAVTKTYRTVRGPILALASVDLDVRPGEFVSVLGPSGCGKSTLLSVLAGLETPTAGEVSVAGQAVRRPVVDAGFMFQKDLLLDWRTCERNLLLQFEMRGEPWRRHRARARELLDMVGLGEFAQRHPHELSGGMRQRVALCRALVHSPPVLFMDEPFGALDALTREELNTELRRITTEQRTTVLFVTHGIEEAVFLSDRVVTMSARPGRVAGECEIALPSRREPEVREHPEFLRATAHLRRLLGAAHHEGGGAGSGPHPDH